jgi:hypothetical protein
VWFPVAPQFDKDAALRKEQGTRAAGYAITPLFDAYFLLQGVCGFVAAVTALGWVRAEPGVRVHKIRAEVVLLALATVVAGWPIERYVGELRDLRNQAVDEQLRSGSANQEHFAAVAKLARAEFGRWHLYSLLLNFVTVILVAVAMALTACLPARPPTQPQTT